MSAQPGNPEAPNGRRGRGLARNQPVEAPAGPGRAGPSGTWLSWVRAQPELAVAILVFCLVAVGGLMLTIPRGTAPWGPAGRISRDAATGPRPRSPSAARPESFGSRSQEVPDGTAKSETDTAGPWVEESASSPSPRGLALVYFHRTLPPGGDSRYQWIVRLRGARPVLDGVDVVTWQMDPTPKNDGDLVSRDRAADGFPLFGDGPGGWFGVSATVRYKDGAEETLARRIEFPD